MNVTTLGYDRKLRRKLRKEFKSIPKGYCSVKPNFPIKEGDYIYTGYEWVLAAITGIKVQSTWVIRKL